MTDAVSNIPAHACKKRPHREDLAEGEVLCGYCPAKCCSYFALAIDTPETWDEFEIIRWYLLHERAGVFVEDESWYLLVYNRCKCLGEDNRCTAYESRPQICRDYHTDNCEYEDEWVYDHYWETPEQIEEYAEALLGPRLGDCFRSPKPPGP
jgi:Fe-S-cluster containining protein